MLLIGITSAWQQMHPPQAKVIAQREESGIPLRLEKLQYTSGHLLGVSNPCPKIHTLALVKLDYKNSALNSEYINITRTKNSINAALYWQIKAKLREHDLQFFSLFCDCLTSLWDVIISVGAIAGEGNKARGFQEWGKGCAEQWIGVFCCQVSHKGRERSRHRPLS